MHMADALISPAVGGSMWAAAAGLIGYSARRLRRAFDDRRVSLMGVLGAFVFAAQMVNFTIPGTGSSGHLGGGLLLALLLGPEAALIAMASILTVQCLFFGDGGLLALGCNIVNLGLFPCFVAYPLIYRPIVGNRSSRGRVAGGAILAAVVGLQLGAGGVVVETLASGISDLPIGKFVLLMLPIHLAIGLVEGLVTAVVVNFIRAARPEALELAASNTSGSGLRPVWVGLAIAAVAIGGAVSWFASQREDGLEWSLAHAAGGAEPAEPAGGIHGAARRVQDRTALLPDYGFAEGDAEGAEAAWGHPNAGTSLSGLLGGAMTLALAGGAAWLLRRRARLHPQRSP